MKEFKNLKRVAIEEAERMDAAYANKSEFTEKDAEMYKCIMSGLKDQLAVEGMTGTGHYGEEDHGMSGAHGDYDRSYAEGYSRGFSEGQMMSGYYPHMPRRY